MTRDVISQPSKQWFQRGGGLGRNVHQLLEKKLPRHLELVEEEVAGERRVDVDGACLLKVDEQRDRLPIPANPLLAVAVQQVEDGLVADVLLEHGRVAVLDEFRKVRVFRRRVI